jgi:hypothetical protein
VPCDRAATRRERAASGPCVGQRLTVSTARGRTSPSCASRAALDVDSIAPTNFLTSRADGHRRRSSIAAVRYAGALRVVDALHGERESMERVHSHPRQPGGLLEFLSSSELRLPPARALQATALTDETRGRHKVPAGKLRLP